MREGGSVNFFFTPGLDGHGSDHVLHDGYEQLIQGLCHRLHVGEVKGRHRGAQHLLRVAAIAVVLLAVLFMMIGALLNLHLYADGRPQPFEAIQIITYTRRRCWLW
jgi:hypothetical protein